VLISAHQCSSVLITARAHLGTLEHALDEGPNQWQSVLITARTWERCSMLSMKGPKVTTTAVVSSIRPLRLAFWTSRRAALAASRHLRGSSRHQRSSGVIRGSSGLISAHQESFVAHQGNHLHEDVHQCALRARKGSSGLIRAHQGSSGLVRAHRQERSVDATRARLN
jgi:hypothetical protein